MPLTNAGGARRRLTLGDKEMAQTGQSNPGDAANAFVRVLLSDAGRLVGGLSDSQWKCTLEYFGYRCAYTGEEGKLVKEHAIPINRTHCGLHLFGNVVPATRKANNAKGKDNKDYKEFLKGDEDRLRRIEEFMEYAHYRERARPFEDIQRFCQTRYDLINALCAENKDYLKKLMPDSTGHAGHGGTDSGPAAKIDRGSWSPRRGTVGALAEECIARGLSDEETLDWVKDAFPERKTKIASIQWYRSKMRKADRSIPTNSQLRLSKSAGRPK